MKNTNLKIRKDEQGFTLVELAVVMIIIGLLIGGVLKGQELITNARVTATASQMESMTAAVNGFFDSYNATPGDMSTAQVRLPNCAAATFCFAGDGDGIVDTGVGQVAAAAAAAPGAGSANGVESSNFFIHLARGNFITGVDGSAAGPGINVTHPPSPAGGVFNIGDRRSGQATSAGFVAARGAAGADLVGGLYLTIVTAANTAAVAANGPLDAQSAARIDRKLDDGAPDAGSLFASIGAANSCRTAASSALYDEANNSAGCSLAFALR